MNEYILYTVCLKDVYRLDICLHSSYVLDICPNSKLMAYVSTIGYSSPPVWQLFVLYSML